MSDARTPGRLPRLPRPRRKPQARPAQPDPHLDWPSLWLAALRLRG
ncbi:hypothetical protein GTY65_16205 [Streptomyces sp. SID8379]|nr:MULTISPECIES: hypothetical protein [unclassified Streptomyces]MYW65588.1 hypothetical protein [Streptomyces sp. SID8379]